MAITVRDTSGDGATYALVAAHNARSRDEAANQLTYPHADVSSLTSGDMRAPVTTALAITAADGDGTIGKLRTLCIDIYRVYPAMLADALAHKVADPPPALVAPTSATLLADLETFLNAVKADYSTHRQSTTYHYTADATNATSAPDATDQASSDTLANDLKVQINAHIAFGPSTPMLNLVGA